MELTPRVYVEVNLFLILVKFGKFPLLTPFILNWHRNYTALSVAFDFAGVFDIATTGQMVGFECGYVSCCTVNIADNLTLSHSFLFT